MSNKNPDPCGTLGAYWRHRRRGEDPCQPCKTAAAARVKRAAGERMEALRLLANEYPVRYQQILREVRDRD